MTPLKHTDSHKPTTRLDVVVIGAGQAGLSAGYYLARSGLAFVLLEGSARIGDVWRQRWDSLRLFTPASLDGLVGMPFPAPRGYFPTKDEMGDYLESYAARFALPVRCRTKVQRVWRRDGVFVIETEQEVFEAAQVVLALGSYRRPNVPEFSRELDPSIVQLHSCAYRRPGQMADGPLLIVGAGNSGSEIAKELAPAHRTYVAGRDTGQVPFRTGSWLGRNVLVNLLLRIVFHHLLNLSTPLGRKARPKILGKGGPLIRVLPRDLAARGVERTGRVVGVRDGRPLLEDGRMLDVRNVIWATGFHHSFEFIDLPVFRSDGEPRHTRGVSHDVPGLYFLGLHFQYAMSSSMIHGVGRDARRVVDTIRARAAEAAAAGPRETTTPEPPRYAVGA